MRQGFNVEFSRAEGPNGSAMPAGFGSARILVVAGVVWRAGGDAGPANPGVALKTVGQLARLAGHCVGGVSLRHTHPL